MLIQVGDYGDGRVFAELRDASPADASQLRPVMGDLSDATVQALLRSATDVPPNVAVGRVALDALPTLLITDDRRWEIGEAPDQPLATMLAKVRDIIDEVPSTEWVPEQWTVRVGGNDCTLADQPITTSYQTTPMFPHLIGVDPFPDLDCGG